MRIGEPVDLQCHPRLHRDSKDLLEIDLVLRAVLEDAAGRMTERTNVGPTHRLGDDSRQLVPLSPLTRMKTDLHPFALRERRVVKVERAVGEDVALTPRRTRKGEASGSPPRSPQPGDAVRPSRARGQRGRRRVVADGEVFETAIACRYRHLEDVGPAVGPCRVAVQLPS